MNILPRSFLFVYLLRHYILNLVLYQDVFQTIFAIMNFFEKMKVH
jgi:hypothetical protein